MKINEILKDNVSDNRIIKKPYIIAEAGVNHEGDINLAHRLIEEAFEVLMQLSSVVQSQYNFY